MRDPEGLLERAGRSGDPARDQYFLTDERVLDRIGEYATETVDSPGRILEVGPGTGVLTARLLAIGDEVVAIERDPELVAFLRTEFAEATATKRLSVIEGDALEVPLPEYDLCVSNLPYGISSPILLRLLPKVRPMVVMVQREFGERMAATPGTDAYGRLSVTAQYFGAVEVLEIVPPSVFEPKPPVESAIVRTLPGEPPEGILDEAVFFDCVRAIFTQRRKTLRNAIRNTTHLSGIEHPDRLLEALDPDLLDRRPGELPPERYAEISRLASQQRENA